MERIISGNDLRVKFGSTNNEKIVLYTTSCSVSINVDSSRYSYKGSGNWNLTNIGSKGWEMQVDGLYVEQTTSTANVFNDLVDAIINSELVSISFGSESGWSTTYKGYAYVVSTNLTAPVADNSTFSATFKGTGELVRVENPLIYKNRVEADGGIAEAIDCLYYI